MTVSAVRHRRPSSDVRHCRRTLGAVLDRHHGLNTNLGLRRRTSRQIAIRQDSHYVIHLMFVLDVVVYMQLMTVSRAVYNVFSAVDSTIQPYKSDVPYHT